MHLMVAVFTVVAVHGFLAAEEQSQVSDVLARYAEALEKRSHCLHVRSRTIYEWNDAISDQVTLRLAQNEFYRSGRRLNLYLDGFRRVSNVDDANLPAFRRTVQELWDGTTYYHIVNGTSLERSWTSVEKDASQRDTSILAKSYFGAPLEGYFPGHQENVLTILRDEASSARVHSTALDGIPCRLVEAHIKGRGHYRVWFDPEHGYNICRAEVTRDGNELPGGPSPNIARSGAKRLRTVRFVLDKVHFEQSAGIWLPVSGQWEVISVYTDGEMQTMTQHHKCLQAECIPDNSMTDDLFVPHIREGTLVYTRGKSPIPRDVWIDGKPQPDIDWEIIEATNRAVAAYAAELEEKDDKGVLLALGGKVRSSRAESPPRSSGPRTPVTNVNRAGYCGLHCIYGVLRLSGSTLDFSELLKSDYLGSVRGSSLHELKQAAEDHELHAEPVSKLTVADLKASPYPLLLHVRRSHTSAHYDHYVLFLGMEDGKAVVCDPPKLQRVGLSNLISRWDGAGLAISSQRIESKHLVGHGRLAFFVWCGVALGTVALIRLGGYFFPAVRCSLLRRRIALSMVQGAALGIALVLIALTYHLARDTGLLGKASAAELVRRAHVADFLPRIELTRVQEFQARGVTFVDARRRPDYEAGHLHGAVSLPVDANDTDFKRITGAIPAGCKILVYCQSRHCQYADIVAAKLVRENFRDVSILRGGWYEWSKWNVQKAEHSNATIQART